MSWLVVGPSNSRCTVPLTSWVVLTLCVSAITFSFVPRGFRGAVHTVNDIHGCFTPQASHLVVLYWYFTLYIAINDREYALDGTFLSVQVYRRVLIYDRFVATSERQRDGCEARSPCEIFKPLPTPFKILVSRVNDLISTVLYLLSLGQISAAITWWLRWL